MLSAELKLLAQRWAACRFNTFSDIRFTTSDVVAAMPELVRSHIGVQAVLNDIDVKYHEAMAGYGVDFYHEFLAEPMKQLYGIHHEA